MEKNTAEIPKTLEEAVKIIEQRDGHIVQLQKIVWWKTLTQLTLLLLWFFGGVTIYFQRLDISDQAKEIKIVRADRDALKKDRNELVQQLNTVVNQRDELNAKLCEMKRNEARYRVLNE